VPTAGQIPVGFRLAVPPGVPVDGARYSLWAAISDGANAWTSATRDAVTFDGLPGGPVAVLVTFREDLRTGEVSGRVTGLPPGVAGPDASWQALVVRTGTDDVVGFDAGWFAEASAEIAVPFDVAAIDPGAEYDLVVRVAAGDHEWTSAAMLVITSEPRFAGIELPVATP
jgi:uncharacterized lipoprotein YbaY